MEANQKNYGKKEVMLVAWTYFKRFDKTFAEALRHAWDDLKHLDNGYFKMWLKAAVKAKRVAVANAALSFGEMTFRTQPGSFHTQISLGGEWFENYTELF